MRVLIYIVIVLCLAVWLGVKIEADPGYVLVSYSEWTLETTLWFALFTITVIFLLLFLIFRILRGISRTGYNISRWSKYRKRYKARKATNLGFRMLAEGQWGKAEKQLIKRVKDSEIPFINYLVAARAAQAQGDYKRRDEYFRRANMLKDSSKIAVTLNQARLQLKAKQYEEAAATLSHLHTVIPNHIYVMRLLKEAYESLNDWDQLWLLLPSLKKRAVFKSTELQELEFIVAENRIRNLVAVKNWKKLDEIFKNLPSNLRSNSGLVAIYVEALMLQERPSEALGLISEILKKSWDKKLVIYFGLMVADDPVKQLSLAEGWLKSHGKHASLLLTLGRICKRAKLWGKAREYLDACIRHKGNKYAYFELAQLLEETGEIAKANYYYKQGLLLAAGK